MATVGDIARKERSYSSASTTYSVLDPGRRLPSHRVTRAPTSAVGSRPADARASAVIAVVTRGGLPKGLGPPDDRQASAPRRLELRMVFRHRRRDHQRSRARDVGGVVSGDDIDPELPQIVDADGFGVAASDLHPSPRKELSESAHSGSRDSYEMDWASVVGIQKHPSIYRVELPIHRRGRRESQSTREQHWRNIVLFLLRALCVTPRPPR